jgi:hypothetical protein
MMNKRLFEALISVSSSASSAKQLATEVLVKSSPQLVKELYDKISQLEATIADLTNFVNEPEDVSDEESRVLADNLTLRLKDIDPVGLHQMGRTYLSMFPKFVRPIVATVLKNKALELNMAPLAIWLDVIALDGEIK